MFSSACAAAALGMSGISNSRMSTHHITALSLSPRMPFSPSFQRFLQSTHQVDYLAAFRRRRNGDLLAGRLLFRHLQNLLAICVLEFFRFELGFGQVVNQPLGELEFRCSDRRFGSAIDRVSPANL